MENGQIKNIIDKIKAENIVPESKLHLNWKNYLFWVLWVGMLILGALFFSLMVLGLLDIRPEVFHYLKLGRVFRVIFLSLPLFWVGLSVLALVSGILALRKTKRGYRHSLIFITSLGLLIITMVGGGLHFFQMNQRFEKGLLGAIPGQKGIMFPASERWKHPEDGLLGGEVGEVFSDYFWLKTFHDGQWKIIYTKDTKLATEGLLTTGNQVGVIGEKTDEGAFEAKFIGNFSGRRHDERMMEQTPFAPKPPRSFSQEDAN